MLKAVNSELFGKLFEPHGPLDKGMLGEENGTSPVALLINYRSLRLAAKYPVANSRIKDALRSIGGDGRILTFDDLKCLKFLRCNRNKAEHPDPAHPYTETDMQKLLRDVCTMTDCRTGLNGSIKQPDSQYFFDFGESFHGNPKVLCKSAPH